MNALALLLTHATLSAKDQGSQAIVTVLVLVKQKQTTQQPAMSVLAVMKSSQQLQITAELTLVTATQVPALQQYTTVPAKQIMVSAEATITAPQQPQ